MIMQGFCIYHAYKNKASSLWYLLIIMVPFLGSCAYLIYHFYNRRNIENITEGVKGVINTNYEVERLEKEVNFSDTILNKSLLAEKYLELRRFDEARDLYDSCLEGFNQNNPKIIMKLVKANYLLKDYDKAIVHGDLIKNDPQFRKSEELVYYAWSLQRDNQLDVAEELFESLDSKYSNYIYRLEYCKFLKSIDKTEVAIAKLNELIEEFEQMESYEKRLNKSNKKTAYHLLGELTKRVKA